MAPGAPTADLVRRPPLVRFPLVRATIAVTVLVGVALWSSGQFLASTLRVHAQVSGHNLVVYYHARFRDLRRMLPRHGVVGYVSDDPKAGREYYMAQYVLAPVVLDQTTARALVVGNFFDPARASAVAEGYGLVLLCDFGEGVMLFRGHGP